MEGSARRGKRIPDVTEAHRADRQSGKLFGTKILIHGLRGYKDRAKDLLYMHDTIEVFSETLNELQRLFRSDVAPNLHSRRIAELERAAGTLFKKVTDTIREAALIAGARKLNPERLAETSRAGLNEIFGLG